MRFETRRERAQRIKRQKKSAILGFISVFALVLILGIALWTEKQSLSAKNLEYEAEKTELQTQIAQQQQRQNDLEEYKKYIQTKKFVEQVAKDKFGLIYPDELVLKPQN